MSKAETFEELQKVLSSYYFVLANQERIKMIEFRMHTFVSLSVMFGALCVSSTQALSQCQNQFIDVANGIGRTSLVSMADFIDPDTNESDCKIALCQGSFEECDKDSSLKEDLVLVFSDEFEKPLRRFRPTDKDKRWTAEDIYYFPTQDLEVYKPEQVITWAGRAVITINRTDPTLPKEEWPSSISQQPNGTEWDVPKPYVSGMVNSWNKWCYTGGYVEMKVKFPGDSKVPGFWPAFWVMGNLGRAGYMQSTEGFWPYSYNYCGDGVNMSNSIPGSKVPSQRINACDPTSPYYSNIDHEKYGMRPNIGRGAPEFDVFEGAVKNGNAEISQTLQMAPLLPEGQRWDDMNFYSEEGLSPGVHFPGETTPFRTRASAWDGKFNRPGNAFQDSISAITDLSPDFFENFHTFGVDWAPGEYLRWYIDGVLLYEINPNALVARSGKMNGTEYNIGPRLLPEEPMYLIFNLGMSLDFSEVYEDDLEFPSYMFVEYIRAYQRPNKLNVGCNPPEARTAQWINCNKEKYQIHSDDYYLFGECQHQEADKSAAIKAPISFATAISVTYTVYAVFLFLNL